LTSESEQENPPRILGMTKRQRIELTAAAVVLLLGLVWYWAAATYHVWPDRYYDDYYRTHDYTLDIVPETSGEYSVLCPIPVTYMNRTPYTDFVKELDVNSSEVSLALEQTQYGWALNVTGHGSVNITWKAHWHDNGGKSAYGNLSMVSYPKRNHENATVAFKSRGGTLTVTVDFEYFSRYGYGGMSHTYYASATAVDDGWHEALVTLGGAIYN
jgi:hypothetical protein